MLWPVCRYNKPVLDQITGRATSTKSSEFSQCTIKSIPAGERTVSINEEEEEKEQQEMASVCSSCSHATEVKRRINLLVNKKGDVTELEMISVQTYSLNA